MNGTNSSSFSARLCFSLVSMSLIAVAIYLGRSILTPLFFSIILALLLSPITNFLIRKEMHRFLAILVPLVLGLLIIASIVYFLSFQVSIFLNDIPELKRRFSELLAIAQRWVNEKFNITFWQQDQYLSKTAEQMKDSGPQLLQKTFITVTEIISYFLLFPIYTFLILYHKSTIKKFLVEIFTRNEEDRVVDVLHESQSIILQYVTGLLIELCIVFSLNSTGFLIFGIKYPIFLALVASLLNIVPYIGMLVANIFCILITMVSSESIQDIFIVAAVPGGVQIIDNNILMPLVVGNKVRINALAIITGVMVGGALAGIPGMFLAIPGIALMKVIFEGLRILSHGQPYSAMKPLQRRLKKISLKKRSRGSGKNHLTLNPSPEGSLAMHISFVGLQYRYLCSIAMAFRPWIKYYQKWIGFSQITARVQKITSTKDHRPCARKFALQIELSCGTLKSINPRSPG